MSRNGIRYKTFVFMAAGAIVMFVGGCGCSKKLAAVREENQVLKQRVAELEEQQTASETAAGGQEMISGPIYIVVEGDSLWSIAKKKLGNGDRYKEILALNPHIKKDEPLAIGTKLLLPPDSK